MAVDLGFKTWLERLESNRFDEWTKSRMIDEMPHTYFAGNLPPELD